MFILHALDSNGSVSFYTGGAGDNWTSADKARAFTYKFLDRARAVAANHNRMTPLHGLRFVAIRADGQPME